jgi:hypothetical protein
VSVVDLRMSNPMLDWDGHTIIVRQHDDLLQLDYWQAVRLACQLQHWAKSLRERIIGCAEELRAEKAAEEQEARRPKKRLKKQPA